MLRFCQGNDLMPRYYQGRLDLGHNQIILLGAKVVLSSIAAAWSASWLAMLQTPSYNPSEDSQQKPEQLNIFFNQIFSLKSLVKCEVGVAWSLKGKLLSTMVHDAQGSIAAKSDSQRVSGFTNLRVSIWGSGHHWFSPDLISLILWLSGPNFADR